MSADTEEQEDELLALHSIFDSEEFVQDESKAAGEIRVSVELPADFTVALKEGETLSQYDVSFLPPLLLTFELPEDYPSSSPPSFSLTCSWLTQTQLSALGAQLKDLYQATGGTVVLFTWVQFLKEDALRFLDIHTLLELPSDKHTTKNYSQDSLHAALSQPKNNRYTSDSGPSDDQNHNVSAPSLDVENPTVILADGEDPLTSGSSTKVSQGAVALNPCKAHQNNSTSHHSSQNDPNSRPNANDQETFNDSNQTPKDSEAREAEQTLQTSEFKSDYLNNLPAAGKSKPLPVVQWDQSGQEDFINEGSVSDTLLHPPNSSDSQDESGRAAASQLIHGRESPPNEDRTCSGLSLTQSQILLSQLLIYDAAQREKQFATTVFDCGVCFMSFLGSDCVQLPECSHIFCRSCFGHFCKLQITEGSVLGVTCLQADCTATPTPAQVKSLVGEELFSRYDRLLLQKTLDCMPDVIYCPRTTCGSVVINENSGTAAMCAVCSFAFCVTCRKTYHGTDDCPPEKIIIKQKKKALEGRFPERRVRLPKTQEGIKALWDDYDSGSERRKKLLESRYGRTALQDTVAGHLSKDWIALNSKNCPYCLSRIQKDGGCNVMTCAQCRRQFCWACRTKLMMMKDGHEHFKLSSCPPFS